ncbi:MAG: hypothetical protein SVO26_06695 [Chloroflexota bacterium]|nr:hypothetical protein [Chloroflexota bacterium]
MERKLVFPMALVLVLSLLLVPAIALAQVPIPVPPKVIASEGATVEVIGGVDWDEDWLNGNYTQIQITPRYQHLRLQPGESAEFEVTAKNLEDADSIATQPHVVIQPYSEYILYKSWITITPSEAEIAAEAEQEYTVEVAIPEDADIGYYNASIAFTDEEIQTPYPAPYPLYINSIDLSIDVWKMPSVQISTSYIHDRVEAGESQTYSILLENISDNAISLDPQFGGGDMYYITSSSYSYGPSMLPEEWVSIVSPGEIAAHSQATIEVNVNIPSDAKGYYEAQISLNIDDPALQEWDQMVHFNLEVWEQPTTPYSKEFTANEGDTITIEVSANQYQWERYNGIGQGETPSFEVTLVSPDGEALNPEAAKKVIHEQVNLGMSYLPPWEISGAGIYQLGNTQYSEQYVIDAATSGTWTLEILPQNTESFEYTIELEG